MAVRILSWNINGIRGLNDKKKKKIQGLTFSDWVVKEDADIVCVQETKAHINQLTEGHQDLVSLGNYHSYFSSAEEYLRKPNVRYAGYSGVAVYSKIEPIEVMHEIGSPVLDKEGRTLILDFGSFVLFNIYYPNGKGSPARLKYKMDFYDAFLKRAEDFKNAGKTVVICGDFNTAHKEIDLARPKENSKVSGFLPVERDWMDKFVNSGFVDTFREFNTEPENYTWWDQFTKARERNVGWRIDYFFIDAPSVGKLTDAFIMADVMGSDHCPLGIDFKDD